MSEKNRPSEVSGEIGERHERAKEERKIENALKLVKPLEQYLSYDINERVRENLENDFDSPPVPEHKVIKIAYAGKVKTYGEKEADLMLGISPKGDLELDTLHSEGGVEGEEIDLPTAVSRFGSRKIISGLIETCKEVVKSWEEYPPKGLKEKEVNDLLRKIRVTIKELEGLIE